jgi:methyltransferase of FxLD system
MTVQSNVTTGRVVPDLAHYDRAMADLIARWSIPGAALGIAKDGRLVLARGYGLAFVEEDAPVRPDSLFRIASVTKPITAAAVLKLVEQGRLALDAPAFSLLDHLEPPPDATVDPRIWDVTIRHLLQHSGGWDRDQSFDPTWHPLVRAGTLALGDAEPVNPATVVRVMLGQPLDFDPGSRCAYSNFGYVVLGRVIEKVTGQPYEEYVRQEILAPLGITRMRIGGRMPDEMAEGEVRYYDPGARTIAPGTFWSTNKTRDAAGGWIASAVDLVRFLSALDGLGAPPLLTPETVQAMRARPDPPLWVDSEYYYGLGWNVRPQPDVTSWWHEGSLPRTIARLRGDSHGDALAVLFNTRPESIGAFFDDLRETLREARRQEVTWPDHDLFQEYAGTDRAPDEVSTLATDTSAEATRRQAALVETLESKSSVSSPAVFEAFRAVPRHLFLPDVALAEVYRDRAIGTKRIDDRYVSSSSQPQIMAIMLEMLDLQPGHRVLEIGAGTGFNAALLAHLVGETGEVTAIDVDEDIVEAARAHLAAAGRERVRVVLGDGALGRPELAPFDRIVLTVAATDLSPAWWEQLRPDGRLLLPLRIGGIRTQKVVAFERAGDHLETATVREGFFMMLRGSLERPQTGTPLGTETGLSVWSDELPPLDPEERYRQLTGPSREWPTGVTIEGREIWGGLQFWLGLREPGLVQFHATVGARDAEVRRWLIPYAHPTGSATLGLLGEGGLAHLLRTEAPSRNGADETVPSFEIVVRGCGDTGRRRSRGAPSLVDADALAARLVEHVREWDVAGRRTGAGLRIRAYPTANGSDTIPAPGPGEIVVPKRHVTLILDWPSA